MFTPQSVQYLRKTYEENPRYTKKCQKKLKMNFKIINKIKLLKSAIEIINMYLNETSFILGFKNTAILSKLVTTPIKQINGNGKYCNNK